MQTKPDTYVARATRCNRKRAYALLICVLAGAVQADAAAAARATTTYTVIQLSPSYVGGAINGKGQVAFTEQIGSANRARFYDGTSVRDLGTLGGTSATASDLNDVGQVTGDAGIDADGGITHAYRWSAATGMLDLSLTVSQNRIMCVYC